MILAIIIIIVAIGLCVWLLCRAIREREELNRVVLSNVKVGIPHGLPCTLNDHDKARVCSRAIKPMKRQGALIVKYKNMVIDL